MVHKRIFSKLIFDATLSETESLRAGAQDNNDSNLQDRDQPRLSINTEACARPQFRRLLTTSPKASKECSPLKHLATAACNITNKHQLIQY